MEKKAKKTEREVSNIVRNIKIPQRGRTFKGVVTRKFPKRVAIEFERTLFIPKYERFLKKKTRLHARLPDELANEIHVGDLIQIKECRPLSKLIHFIVVKKITREEK